LKYADLTPELERDLVARYQSGDRAAGAALLEAHVPILMRLICGLFGRGVDSADVKQTVFVEFLDHAMKWDRSPACRLTSFASQNAFYRTKTTVWEDTTIRLCEYALIHRMACRKRGEYAPESLASKLALRSTVDIDMPIRGADNDATTLRDTIPSLESGPESRFAGEEAAARRCAMAIEALSALDAREREILRRRYMGDERESLEDIGRSMGISGDRVGQLCKRAAARAASVVRSVMRDDDAILWGGEWKQPVRRDVAEAA
jgi:RNA polymerase sigma-32 factor